MYIMLIIFIVSYNYQKLMVQIREVKRARTILNNLAYDSEMVKLDTEGVIQNGLVFLTKVIEKKQEESVFNREH